MPWKLLFYTISDFWNTSSDDKATTKGLFSEIMKK